MSTKTTLSLSCLLNISYSSSAAAAAALVGNSKDLVGEILSRLPLSSVMRFRLVCKEWCSLITSTQSFNINNYRCFVVQYFNYDSHIITGIRSTSKSDHFNTLFFNLDDDDNNSNIFKMKVVREYLRGRGSVGETNYFFHKKRYYDIKLISSYRGFLLFTAKPVAASMSVSARFRRWLTKDKDEEEEEEDDQALIILYNPVTKEQYTVAAPPETHDYCGFYYHSPTKEYRILLLYQLNEFVDPHNRYRLTGGVVQFLVFGLQTQVMRVLKLPEEVHPYSNKIKKKMRTRTTTRRIRIKKKRRTSLTRRLISIKKMRTRTTWRRTPTTTRRPDVVDDAAYGYYYYPDPSTPPVISNGSLHWIVSENHYYQLPHCSHTILCFGMESEEFRLMPHPKLSHHCSPGGIENHRRHHMNLLEMDGGILCLCDGYYSGRNINSRPILEIYVMEDYKNWTWVRRYHVDLSNYIHDGCQYGFYYKALQILQGDQLLLHYHPRITHPYIGLTQQLQFRRRPEEYALYSLNQQHGDGRLRPAVASSSTGMVRKSSKKKKNKRQRFQVWINGYPGDELIGRLRIMIIKPKKKMRPPIVMGNMVVLTPSLASFQHNRSTPGTGTGTCTGTCTSTFFSIRSPNVVCRGPA